jgi:hypothetical protein
MRRIRYRFRRHRGCWGRAWPHESRIEIDPALADKSLLDVLLHEGLHVVFPIIDEETINEAGTSLADLLWRIGFRLKDKDEDD